MALWLFRAGSPGEHEKKFLDDADSGASKFLCSRYFGVVHAP